MRHPGAIVAGPDFTQLVFAYFGHGRLIGLGVVLDGNLRRHATHRMSTAPMAGGYQEFDIGSQKRLRHGDLGAVRQDALRAIAELFDVAEDVIPTAAVQAGGVLAQFPQDLVHFERGQNSLDEDRRLNGAAGDAKVVLRSQKYGVPQTRFVPALELRQIEIRSRAVADQVVGVVKEVQAEIEERCRDRLSFHQEVLLDEVPSAWAHHEDRGILTDLVALAFGTGISDSPVDGVAQIRLAFDDVLPRRRIGIFEIGHEDLRARVQRVDDHFPIRWAGDFDAAVHQVGGAGRDLPRSGTDLGSLGRKSGLLALVDLMLPGLTRLQQSPPSGLELRGQFDEELDSLGCKNGVSYLSSRPHDPYQFV